MLYGVQTEIGFSIIYFYFIVKVYFAVKFEQNIINIYVIIFLKFINIVDLVLNIFKSLFCS